MRHNTQARPAPIDCISKPQRNTSVKEGVVEERPWWKKDKRRPVFVHKEEAFAAYSEGIQKLKLEKDQKDEPALS